MYILYIFTIKNNFLLLNFIYIIFTILYIYLNIKKIHIYVSTYICVYYDYFIYLNVNIIKSINFSIKKTGPLRDLNPGPPAPKAGIIPLDQEAS